MTRHSFIAASFVAASFIASITLLSHPVAALGNDLINLYDEFPEKAFHFPTSPGPGYRGPTVFENLADGRLIAVSTLLDDPDAFVGTPELYVESDVGSRDFLYVGDLPLDAGASWSAFGGAFLEVSPDGSRVAIGDNDFGTPRVGVVDTADLLNVTAWAGMPIDWFEVPHFTASWWDNQFLAINAPAGAGSQVTFLDTLSSPASPINPTVIGNIGGASAAVSFDAEGNLYTGNGYDTAVGGSDTGTIKRFEAADWAAALVGATPLDFEAETTVVDTLLSAGGLEFDNDGNLIVGGGDYFGGGQTDFFAVVLINDAANEYRVFDPATDTVSQYVIVYNEVTGEILAYEPFATEFGEAVDNTLVHVVAPRLAGDANGDGSVDGLDYLVWSGNFGSSEPPALTASDGDFNGDGAVDGNDYLIWAGNYGASLSSPLAAAVPEPAALLLLATGVSALWLRRSPRSRIMAATMSART
ncbi:MAG: PEP-CTERM sorting domain-containing protein [Pirellulales bacterium]